MSTYDCVGLMDTQTEEAYSWEGAARASTHSASHGAKGLHERRSLEGGGTPAHKVGPWRPGWSRTAWGGPRRAPGTWKGREGRARRAEREVEMLTQMSRITTTAATPQALRSWHGVTPPSLGSMQCGLGCGLGRQAGKRVGDARRERRPSCRLAPAGLESREIHRGPWLAHTLLRSPSPPPKAPYRIRHGLYHGLHHGHRHGHRERGDWKSLCF